MTLEMPANMIEARKWTPVRCQTRGNGNNMKDNQIDGSNVVTLWRVKRQGNGEEIVYGSV
jgi:hypothetical protein